VRLRKRRREFNSSGSFEGFAVFGRGVQQRCKFPFRGGRFQLLPPCMHRYPLVNKEGVAESPGTILTLGVRGGL